MFRFLLGLKVFIFFKHFEIDNIRHEHLYYFKIDSSMSKVIAFFIFYQNVSSNRKQFSIFENPLFYYKFFKRFKLILKKKRNIITNHLYNLH